MELLWLQDELHVEEHPPPFSGTICLELRDREAEKIFLGKKWEWLEVTCLCPIRSSSPSMNNRILDTNSELFQHQPLNCFLNVYTNGITQNIQSVGYVYIYVQGFVGSQVSLLIAFK